MAFDRQPDLPSLTDLIKTRDPVMAPLLHAIRAAAQVPSNVVVQGETGTGKELVARALHQFGPRASEPFVAFNCAAIPESLLESELFGHMKGAFTDARENKAGLFLKAHGGTLFLDEIGDASLAIQTKLLRVLQEREILPVGATCPIPIDVRVIAATHRDLQQEVETQRFRQDLYFRLHVLPIHVPPLRERPRDIVFLAQHFAESISTRMGVRYDGFSWGAERALEQHLWPGNVRELQNRIEYALAMSHSTSDGGTIDSSRLFPEQKRLLFSLPGSESSPKVPSYSEAKESFERSYLKRLLTVARGNIAAASRLASKSRSDLYGLLRKHSLDPGTFKEAGAETDRSG